MSIVIDGIIQDWDARYRRETRPRRGRNIKGGTILPRLPSSDSGHARATPRARLEMTTSKTPEVMVKITGGGKNIGRIKAHFDYISRNGKVELENEEGDILSGRDDVRDLRDEWAMGRGGIPKEGELRREAYNIILSMPPGTPRQAVTDAARQFALVEFANHQYVMATHTDEQHPHVHLCVRAVDREGVRLNPRKADLQRWREHFADRLREQGIAANATPRWARGVVKKAEKQAVRWIDKQYREGKRRAPSHSRAGRDEAIRRELAGEAHENPARANIERARRDAIRSYGKVARALAKSVDPADRQLALKITSFVQGFPPLKTRHQSDIERARATSGKTTPLQNQNHKEL
jgi:hypothetical protein